jgi:hypothetical protein
MYDVIQTWVDFNGYTGFGTSLGMDPSLGMGVPWLHHSMYLYKNLEDDRNCMFLLADEVRK